MKAGLKRSLKILVSVGFLIGLVVLVGNPAALVRQMSSLSPIAFILALLLNTADRALMTYKWLRLLRVKGCTLGLLKGLKTYCSSMLLGLFLPSTFGPDAIRAAMTTRAGVPGQEVVGSIAIERILGFIATPILALSGLTILRARGDVLQEMQPVWWVAVAGLVFGLLTFLLALSERFHDLIYHKVLGRLKEYPVVGFIRQSHESFRAYRHHGFEIAVFFLLTVVENLFPIIITWIVTRGLGIEISLALVTAAVPLAYFVSRLPFSVAGIGVYESVVVLVLSLEEVALQDSLAVVLLTRVLQILTWLPWWFAMLFERSELSLSETDPSPDS